MLVGNLLEMGSKLRLRGKQPRSCLNSFVEVTSANLCTYLTDIDAFITCYIINDQHSAV